MKFDTLLPGGDRLCVIEGARMEENKKYRLISVKLNSKRRMFFRSTSVYIRHAFSIIKFRTIMRTNTPQAAPTNELNDPKK